MVRRNDSGRVNGVSHGEVKESTVGRRIVKQAVFKPG